MSHLRVGDKVFVHWRDKADRNIKSVKEAEWLGFKQEKIRETVIAERHLVRVGDFTFEAPTEKVYLTRDEAKSGILADIRKDAYELLERYNVIYGGLGAFHGVKGPDEVPEHIKALKEGDKVYGMYNPYYIEGTFVGVREFDGGVMIRPSDDSPVAFHVVHPENVYTCKATMLKEGLQNSDRMLQRSLYNLQSLERELLSLAQS